MRLAVALSAAALVAACDRGGGDQAEQAAGAAAATQQHEVAGEPGACASELEGPIDAPLVLTRRCSPYLINQPGLFEVTDLTVEPGVHLRFLADSGLALAGRFEIAGTARQPVRLTGLDDGARWTGIVFQPGAAGRLEHAVVRGATDGTLGHSLTVKREVRVELLDVAIESGGDTLPTAIFLDGEAASGSRIERVTATGYERGLVTMGEAAGALGSGNRLGTVEIHGGTISAPVTFAGDTTYLLGRIDVAGEGAERPAITLEPGATLRFRSMGWLRLERAELHAVGDARRPIRLVAAEDDGRWAGLRIGRATRGSKLQHAVVSGAVGPEKDAAVYVGRGGELLVTEVAFERLADVAEAAVVAECETTVNVAKVTAPGAKARDVLRIGCE